MYVGRTVPRDAPDPLYEVVEQLREMPVPIWGLVPQPHLEDWGALGQQSLISDGVLDQMTAVVGYTLWRNPDDRDDPINLANLDERTRAALDVEPPHPRPQWLAERVARMRYPMLSEAVRTTWNRGRSRQDVGSALVEHVNHLLVNNFGASYAGDPRGAGSDRQLADLRMVEPGPLIVVDGAARDSIQIDADPDVLGIGADLGDGGLLTAAIPRAELGFIDVAFAPRSLPEGS
jgi:hypothetical protein